VTLKRRRERPWWERPFWRAAMRQLSSDLSPLGAARLIALYIAVAVVLGAVLMRLVDGAEYPTMGRALWWAMQTVTTVGYGDVVPRSTAGRLTAAFVMLTGIGFVSVMTAAVTAIFVQASRRMQIEELDDPVLERLDRIEAALTRTTET